MKILVSTLIAFIVSFASYAALPPITGTLSVCDGSVTTLSNPVVGGTWSSSDVSIAFIGAATGITTGVNPGTATITYTDGVDIATAVITVNPLPTSITGSPFICTGVSSTLSSSPAGGLWSSSNPAIATVGFATGIVTGTSIGTTAITYTLPTGCSTIIMVTVNSSPGTMTGVSSICAGSTSTLSVSGGFGGTWSSSATSVATVST